MDRTLGPEISEVGKDRAAVEGRARLKPEIVRAQSNADRTGAHYMDRARGKCKAFGGVEFNSARPAQAARAGVGGALGASDRSLHPITKAFPAMP